jgi:glycosyltransferase involved in cell wall biosynthesis
MGLKLSIIVPIYKVEQYLCKCVDSLLNQDVEPKEYEIILVDDGSPDHCGEICEDYAARCANIKVVHRDNGGLSAARNSGIDAAKGEYIQFVDSDDFLEPNVLGTLVKKMDAGHLDVLRFNYQNVNENNEVFEPNKVSKPFVDYSDEVCDGLVFITERLGFGCYAWQFLVRRELLEDCRFKEGVYFEDTEWTPRLLLKSRHVASTDLIVYNYLLRQGSITQSVDEKKKRKVLDDKLLLIDSMQEQMRTVSDKRWFEGMVAQTTLSVLGDVCENYYGERKTIVKNLKQKKVFPLSSFHATKAAARKICLANVSSLLLCWLVHLKNNRI